MAANLSQSPARSFGQCAVTGSSVPQYGIRASLKFTTDRVEWSRSEWPVFLQHFDEIDGLLSGPCPDPGGGSRLSQEGVTRDENCSFGELCRSGFIEFRCAANLSVLTFSLSTAGDEFVCR
jgi:hypothetical protein